jgi:tetratricopeptide (TPR) repeat protein
MREVLFSAWILVLLALSGINIQSYSLADCISIRSSETNEDVSDLLESASVAFLDDEDLDFVQLCHALNLFEQILEIEPEHREALNKSSQAYFMLGLVYLEDVDERLEAYSRGRERGLSRLGIESPGNKDFLCAVSLPVILVSQNSETFSQNESELAGLFWAGNNWGRWLDNLSEVERFSKGFSDLPCIQAIFEKSVELDEVYFGAGPHRALSSFLAQLPGPNLILAREHIERAIELSPDFLENKIVLACGIAVLEGDRELFDQLLSGVLNSSNIGQYFFWNNRAMRLASELLSSADAMFSGSEQCEL